MGGGAESKGNIKLCALRIENVICLVVLFTLNLMVLV